MTLPPLTRLTALICLLVFSLTPARAADVRTVDPNASLTAPTVAVPVTPKAPAQVPPSGDLNADLASKVEPQSTASAPLPTGESSAATPTYHKDDLIGSAEGVFGKGAKGLAELIQKILKDQGEPNAYIAGREASGAFVVGLRYGSGTLSHKVEGQRPVYWTGPSLGFDLGGDADKMFVLVYNLYDSQDLYRRYPQVEGRAYFVGGFSATYLRRGNVAIIPIKLGVGLRLGANIGYMKFSEKSKWLPF
jgi:hypothetical protein